MADNNTDPPVMAKKAFHPASTVAYNPGAAHGIKVTVNTQHFVTPVKI
jgi:hypothetical protein